MPNYRSCARSRRGHALWGLAVGLLLAAPVAHANNTVAVLGVEPAGVAAPVAARFSAALKEHVQRTAGYRLVAGKALEEIKLVFGCMNESPSCMAKVGKSLNARLLLWGRVAKRKKGGLKLTLRLLDVQKKKVRKKLQQVFSGGEAAAPEARVLALAGKLLPPQAATLRLRCEVEGAQVLLDGRPAGLVDIRGVLVLTNVPLGKHQIEVRRKGFRPFSRSVVLKAGQAIDLQAKMVAEVPRPDITPPDDSTTPPDDATTPVTPEPKGDNTGWKITFYSSLAATVGLGVGLVVNGLKVLSLEDDKNAAITALVSNAAPDDRMIPELDAKGCDLVGIDSRYPGVHGICEDGKDRQMVQNILIGVTAAAGVLAGFAAYKAFFSGGGSSEEEEARGPGTKLSRWQLQPAIGPQGASLGLSLNF